MIQNFVAAAPSANAMPTIAPSTALSDGSYTTPFELDLATDQDGWTNEVWVCNYDPPGNFVGQTPF